MKLRARGNSIRLRLSQSDLATLLDCGVVEERIEFPNGSSLRYRLECSEASTPDAAYADGAVTVRFPKRSIDAWADPAEVSLSADCAIEGGTLDLLVEKDYQCLAPREGEDDDDLFPNPGA
jgi:hypothetical protein